MNQAMLDSVVRGDWETYAGFCADDLSCFEAETNGLLAEGLAFHRYYFELPGQAPEDESNTTSPVNVTMARPHLRWLGDGSVVISYTRLTQRLSGGSPVTSSCSETRIWQQQNGQWKQVHVHRS